MKKKIILSMSALFLGSSALASPLGKWQTEEGNDGGYAVILIETCSDSGETYCGTIVDLVDSPDQSFLGATIIKDMSATSATTFASGQIWAPDEDRWYRAKMELNDDILTVSGCVLGGAICRGQEWVRL